MKKLPIYILTVSLLLSLVFILYSTSIFAEDNYIDTGVQIKNKKDAQQYFQDKSLDDILGEIPSDFNYIAPLMKHDENAKLQFANGDVFILKKGTEINNYIYSINGGRLYAHTNDIYYVAVTVSIRTGNSKVSEINMLSEVIEKDTASVLLVPFNKSNRKMINDQRLFYEFYITDNLGALVIFKDLFTGDVKRSYSIYDFNASILEIIDSLQSVSEYESPRKYYAQRMEFHMFGDLDENCPLYIKIDEYYKFDNLKGKIIKGDKELLFLQSSNISDLGSIPYIVKKGVIGIEAGPLSISEMNLDFEYMPLDKLTSFLGNFDRKNKRLFIESEDIFQKRVSELEKIGINVINIDNYKYQITYKNKPIKDSIFMKFDKNFESVVNIDGKMDLCYYAVEGEKYNYSKDEDYIDELAIAISTYGNQKEIDLGKRYIFPMQKPEITINNFISSITKINTVITFDDGEEKISAFANQIYDEDKITYVLKPGKHKIKILIDGVLQGIIHYEGVVSYEIVHGDSIYNGKRVFYQKRLINNVTYTELLSSFSNKEKYNSNISHKLQHKINENLVDDINAEFDEQKFNKFDVYYNGRLIDEYYIAFFDDEINVRTANTNLKLFEMQSDYYKYLIRISVVDEIEFMSLFASSDGFKGIKNLKIKAISKSKEIKDIFRSYSNDEISAFKTFSITINIKILEFEFVDYLGNKIRGVVFNNKDDRINNISKDYILSLLLQNKHEKYYLLNVAAYSEEIKQKLVGFVNPNKQQYEYLAFSTYDDMVCVFLDLISVEMNVNNSNMQIKVHIFDETIEFNDVFINTNTIMALINKHINDKYTIVYNKEINLDNTLVLFSKHSIDESLRINKLNADAIVKMPILLNGETLVKSISLEKEGDVVRIDKFPFNIRDYCNNLVNGSVLNIIIEQHDGTLSKYKCIYEDINMICSYLFEVKNEYYETIYVSATKKREVKNIGKVNTFVLNKVFITNGDSYYIEIYKDNKVIENNTYYISNRISDEGEYKVVCRNTSGLYIEINFSILSDFAIAVDVDRESTNEGEIINVHIKDSVMNINNISIFRDSIELSKDDRDNIINKSRLNYQFMSKGRYIVIVESISKKKTQQQFETAGLSINYEFIKGDLKKINNGEIIMKLKKDIEISVYLENVLLSNSVKTEIIDSDFKKVIIEEKNNEGQMRIDLNPNDSRYNFLSMQIKYDNKAPEIKFFSINKMSYIDGNEIKNDDVLVEVNDISGTFVILKNKEKEIKLNKSCVVSFNGDFIVEAIDVFGNKTTRALSINNTGRKVQEAKEENKEVEKEEKGKRGGSPFMLTVGTDGNKTLIIIITILIASIVIGISILYLKKTKRKKR